MLRQFGTRNALIAPDDFEHPGAIIRPVAGADGGWANSCLRTGSAWASHIVLSARYAELWEASSLNSTKLFNLLEKVYSGTSLLSSG
jgi:hypothetical protein